MARYVYLPIDVDTTARYVFPTIGVDAKAVAKAVNFQMTNLAQELDYREKKQQFRKALAEYHQDNHWHQFHYYQYVEVAATAVAKRGAVYSTGPSELEVHVRDGELPMPVIKHMVLTGESIPHALFRCYRTPKDGILSVHELELHEVTFKALSTNDSQQRYHYYDTEITFVSRKLRETVTEINLELKEICSQHISDWEYDNKRGYRTLLSNTTKSLRELAKEALFANPTLTKKARQTLLNMEILSEADFPSTENTILITADQSSKKLKLGVLHQLTKTALLELVASILKVDSSKVQRMYRAVGKIYVEIESDADVSELVKLTSSTSKTMKPVVLVDLF